MSMSGAGGNAASAPAAAADKPVQETQADSSTSDRSRDAMRNRDREYR